ncbi:hypothetical protein Pan161_55410 [Gimesia algae]|uniref:Uncharacterized protein n=1 Tax=Gimesia algae TaxID=2527971 RepID=A0A517VLG3_9PLAN|nr:hypothetical protein Pan161_55410 [Gimesia algae]
MVPGRDCFSTTKNTKPHKNELSLLYQTGQNETDGKCRVERAAKGNWCFIMIGIALHFSSFAGGLISCGRVNLMEGREGIKWILRTGWRSVLIRVRCWDEQCRGRGERLRCVATRRHTSRTGNVSCSANLEKTGSFVVKIKNKCRVFQCTVNWARARLKTAFIAVGTAGSSAV